MSTISLGGWKTEILLYIALRPTLENELLIEAIDFNCNWFLWLGIFNNTGVHMIIDGINRKLNTLEWKLTYKLLKKYVITTDYEWIGV